MSLEHLFSTEVLRWRYGGALAAVLAVQAAVPLLLAAVFRTILVDQVWNPISMVCELLSSYWTNGIVWPSMCLLVLTRIHVHNYTVSGEHSVRVWELLRTVLRLRTLCVSMVVCMCVCAVMHLYAAAAHPEFASVVRPCYTRSENGGVGGVCINSRAMVVLVCAAYCGVLHAAHYTIGNGRLVTMATVSVGKKQRLRSLLSPVGLLRKGWTALWGNQYTLGIKGCVGVIILYTLLGGILEQWAASVLGAPIHNNNPVIFSSQQHQHPAAALDHQTHGGAEGILQVIIEGNEHKEQQPVKDSYLLQNKGIDTNGSSNNNNSSDTSGEHQYSSSWYSCVLLWQRWDVITDPTLAVVLLFAVFLTTLMLQLFYEIFAVFVMQSINIPVAPPLDASPSSPPSPWLLGTALQASTNSTLQVLAYQQLAVLGCTGGQSGTRMRESIFAISHPGGHPRNWNAIMTPTLALIQDFTDKLMKQNCPEEHAAIQSAASNSAIGGKPSADNNQSVAAAATAGQSASSATYGNTSLLGNASLLLNTTVGNTSALLGGNTTTTGGNISLMSATASNVSMAVTNTNKPVNKTTEEKKVSLITKLVSKAMDKIKDHMSIGRRLPLVRYLLSEFPDAANTAIFAAAHPVVLAIQGMCGLVSASFTEDHFGVVQRNMPQIMKTLLMLNLALDKTGRPPLPKRLFGGVGVLGGGQDPHHTQLRRGIKLALRTSFYRLSHTFGNTLLNVPVPANLRPKMQSYLDLMEG